MRLTDLLELLRDERSGMFFLAGFDEPSNGRTGTITIHAANGVLKPENRKFIENIMSTAGAGLELRMRYYNPDELQAADSLERFARMFAHDRILLDPTGAFARLLELVALAKSIRSRFDESIARILWRSDESTLVIVAKAQAADQEEGLRNAVQSFVLRTWGPDLKAAVKSVRVEADAGRGRFTPVDELSRSAPARVVPSPRRRFASVLARVSGLAALLGLSAMTAAHARLPSEQTVMEAPVPGITALLGLTTLGENSYGLRNQFQAIGGLGLYFAGSAHVLTAVVLTGVNMAPLEINPVELKQDNQPQGEPVENKSERDAEKWPLPTRIQYAN